MTQMNNEDMVKQCSKCGLRYPKEYIKCPDCGCKSWSLIDKNLPLNYKLSTQLETTSREFDPITGIIVRKTRSKYKSLVKDKETESGRVNKEYHVDEINKFSTKMISEKVYDPLTGKIIREYSHPVSEHPKNRGNAKKRNLKDNDKTNHEDKFPNK